MPSAGANDPLRTHANAPPGLTDKKMNDYILTLSCPDRIGIVHSVTGWLLNLHGNIIDA